MDKKAVEYGLPLFESGTQGAKGNTQPVIPMLTENYGATSDPPESESYPLCTIKNFPNKPEHVVHFMKEMFEEWFSDFPYKVNNFIENEKSLEEMTDIERNEFPQHSSGNNVLLNKKKMKLQEQLSFYLRVLPLYLSFTTFLIKY